MSMSPDPNTDMRKEQGYRAILKTVIKSQIQLLIEQLSDQAGEESVILTANSTEGTISYFGSSNAKDFYSNHEEIKSQFLAYCDRSRKRKASSTNKTIQNDGTESNDKQSDFRDVRSSKKQKVHSEGKMKQIQDPVNEIMAAESRDQGTNMGLQFEYKHNKNSSIFIPEQAPLTIKVNGDGMYANNFDVEVVDLFMKDPSKDSTLNSQVIDSYDTTNRLHDILNPSIQSPAVGQYLDTVNMSEMSRLTSSLPSASLCPSSTQPYTCIQNLEIQSNGFMQDMRQQASILSPNIQAFSPETATDAYSDIYGTTLQSLNFPSMDGVDDVKHNQNLKREAATNMVDTVICANLGDIVEKQIVLKQTAVEPPKMKGDVAAGGDMIVDSICADSNGVDKPTVLKQLDNKSVENQTVFKKLDNKSMEKPTELKQLDSNIVDKPVELHQPDNIIVEGRTELKQDVGEPPKVKKRRSRSKSARNTANQESRKDIEVSKTDSNKGSEKQALSKDSAESSSNKNSQISVSVKATSMSKVIKDSRSKKVSKESVFEELYKQSVPKLAFEFPGSGKSVSCDFVLGSLPSYEESCPGSNTVNSTDENVSKNVSVEIGNHDFVGKGMIACPVEKAKHVKTGRRNTVKQPGVFSSMYIVQKGEADDNNFRGKRDFLAEAKASGSIFPCEHCGKIFSFRSQYEIHCVTHAKEKPYPCEYCDKRFGLKHQLRRHRQNKHSSCE